MPDIDPPYRVFIKTSLNPNPKPKLIKIVFSELKRKGVH
jgi:hypothetical protein